MIRTAQLVHGVHCYRDFFRFNVLMNAVPKVENMSMAFSITFENDANLVANALGRCIQY